MKMCILYMYISAYINVIHTFKYTLCANSRPHESSTRYALQGNPILSPKLLWHFPLFRTKTSPETNNRFCFQRTFVKNLLFTSWECQLPKNANKKTPTRSFCRFVKNWEQIVTMTILVNYISIQHPPPPKKQKLHMRWKTLSFHLGFPYGTTSVGCNSGSLEDRISLRLPWACEQKGHGWSDG